MKLDLIPRPVYDLFFNLASQPGKGNATSPAVVPDLDKIQEVKLVSTLMQFQREGVE